MTLTQAASPAVTVPAAPAPVVEPPAAPAPDTQAAAHAEVKIPMQTWSGNLEPRRT